MRELLDASVSLVNLPYTVLLCLVLVYWSTVILGVLDHHSFDHDLHTDADVGMGGAHGGFHSLLHFFNVGEVPVMLIVSVMSICMWGASVWITDFFGITSLVIALLLFVPNFVVSAFVAKFVTAPFRAFYRTLEKEAVSHVDVVGRFCQVRTGEVTEAFGQAEVALDQEGVPLRINVRVRNEPPLRKGDEAIVLEYLPEEETYVVTALHSESAASETRESETL